VTIQMTEVVLDGMVVLSGADRKGDLPLSESRTPVHSSRASHLWRVSSITTRGSQGFQTRNV
jgi:hypothetical protein